MSKYNTLWNYILPLKLVVLNKLYNNSLRLEVIVRFLWDNLIINFKKGVYV